MLTSSPTPSVVAGTVTLKVSVTVRSSVVAETSDDQSERLNDVSTARTTYQ